MLSALLILALACSERTAPTQSPEDLAAQADATPTPAITASSTAQPTPTPTVAPIETPSPTPALNIRPETSYAAAPAVKPRVPETNYIPPAAFVSEDFNKTVDGAPVEGRLLRPENPRGAVVLLPTWWGSDKAINDQAVEIAHWNYLTLIVDLYGGKLPTNRAEAARLARGVDQAKITETLKAAVTALADQRTTAPLPVALVGYEWGGTLALRSAMQDHRIKALAVIDPQPPADPTTLKQITCPTLSIFSMRGGMVTKEEVDAFVAGLKSGGVKHPSTVRFTTSPGALLKPSSLAEQTYAKTADTQLRDFLAKMK